MWSWHRSRRRSLTWSSYPRSRIESCVLFTIHTSAWAIEPCTMASVCNVASFSDLRTSYSPSWTNRRLCWLPGEQGRSWDSDLELGILAESTHPTIQFNTPYFIRGHLLRITRRKGGPQDASPAPVSKWQPSVAIPLVIVMIPEL